MADVIPLPIPQNALSHDRFALEIQLRALKAEMGAVLDARPIEDIQADIDDVRRKLKEIS